MTEYRYQPLPDRLFMVKVPYIATLSSAEIDAFGLPVDIDHGTDIGSMTGIYNYQAYNHFTTVMLPLTRIIDIYCNGYEIRINNREDIPIIYEILETYLRGVINVQNFSLNRRMIKEDRLDDIERFANEMFGLNRGVIAQSAFDKTKTTSFNLNLDFMSPQEAFEAQGKIKTIDTGKTYQTTRSTRHLDYPRLPEPKLPTINVRKNNEVTVSRVSPDDLYGNNKTVNDISFVYNGMPKFDVSKVERKPTYRKTFTFK